MDQVGQGGSGKKSLRRSHGKQERQNMQTEKQPRPPCCRHAGNFFPPRIDVAPQLLHDLEREFHLFPAKEKTQIHFPEAPEPNEPVHQELDPQPFPKPRQFDMQGDLAEFQAGVPVTFAVMPGEKVERERIQMPMVGGIAPRTVIGIVGCYEIDGPARAGNAMHFCNRIHYAIQVLDDLHSTDVLKGVVGERQGAVQVADYVRGGGVEINVHSDGPRRLLAPATQLQYSLANGRIWHKRDSSTEERETRKSYQPSAINSQRALAEN